METPEAMAIIAAIQAFRPFPEIPESTQDVWAKVLVGYEAVDGLEAVPVVGRMGGFLELADIERAIREARGRRVAATRRAALPQEAVGNPWMSFHDYLEHHATDEDRELAQRMSPGLRHHLAQMTKGASDVATHSASG